MDFKNNLSKIAKTIGDSASSAAKKSSELFEVTKLNMTIQSHKDKISELEEEIGHLCYKKYKNKESTDNKILKLCKKIDELNKSIANLIQKVSKLKDIKLCDKCELELPSDTKYCPKCGKLLTDSN